MSQEDFASGLELPCCKDKPATISNETQPKPLVQQWIDANRLLNGSRNGLWVPAWKCYEHFKQWLTSRDMMEQIPTATRFGKDLRRFCSRKRKNQGIFYLLDREIV